MILSESGYPGFSGFTGCDGKIVFEEVEMILSESGYSGFEDLQDVMERLFLRKW